MALMSMYEKMYVAKKISNDCEKGCKKCRIRAKGIYIYDRDVWYMKG